MIQHESQVKGAQANRAKALDRSRKIVAAVEAGKSHADIAAELGVNESSVRTLLYRARRRLQVAA